jgi:hypothetical protein
MIMMEIAPSVIKMATSKYGISRMHDCTFYYCFQQFIVLSLKPYIIDNIFSWLIKFEYYYPQDYL